MAQKNILQYIILGFLAQQDLAGYDIKKLFEGELSDFWYANHSQIYPELKRLEEQELIRSHAVTVGTRLEKKYYHITPAGQALLDEWMHEPLGAIVPSRDEFTMKLYLVRTAADPLVRKPFEEEIQRHEEKLEYLQSRWQALFADEEKQAASYGHALILQRAIHRKTDHLAWLRTEYARLPQGRED